MNAPTSASAIAASTGGTQPSPRGGRERPLLCMTFDDGPDAIWTARVLEALATLGVRASFFMLGARVREAPETVRAVLAAGHEVQLHGHRHLRHTHTSARALAADTERGLSALADVGVHPTLWRAPWGATSAATHRLARLHRLRLVGWTIDSEDWRGEPAWAMFARVRGELAEGGVVLMHDALGPGATRTGCEHTVELVERIVLAAREQGVEIGPLTARAAAGPGGPG